jgi:hypothetical protein
VGTNLEATKYVISPMTGEQIPVDQMAEHMRISLIDPKYKEQKEAMMAKLRDSTMAGVRASLTTSLDSYWGRGSPGYTVIWATGVATMFGPHWAKNCPLCVGPLHSDSQAQISPAYPHCERGHNTTPEVHQRMLVITCCEPTIVVKMAF